MDDNKNSKEFLNEKKENFSHIKKALRTIPNFPKKGILFWDITTLLQNPEMFKKACDEFYKRHKDKNIDVVVGIESRGFIFGSVVAYLLGIGFVPVRKPGKLPHKTIKEEYDLEYGKDAVEMHEDAIKKGQNVLVIDDLLATAGTLKATLKLIDKLGGNVIECCFVIELTELKGRDKVKGYNIFSLVDAEAGC